VSIRPPPPCRLRTFSLNRFSPREHFLFFFPFSPLALHPRMQSPYYVSSPCTRVWNDQFWAQFFFSPLLRVPFPGKDSQPSLFYSSQSFLLDPPSRVLAPLFSSTFRELSERMHFFSTDLRHSTLKHGPPLKGSMYFYVTFLLNRSPPGLSCTLTMSEARVPSAFLKN